MEDRREALEKRDLPSYLRACARLKYTLKGYGYVSLQGTYLKDIITTTQRLPADLSKIP